MKLMGLLCACISSGMEASSAAAEGWRKCDQVHRRHPKESVEILAIFSPRLNTYHQLRRRRAMEK
eukprot:6224246-Amphidinium_carterae.1